MPIDKDESFKTVKVDLFLQEANGTVHMFDIKTVKPNMTDFVSYKRTLLEWAAIYLSSHPQAQINTYLAIPYNPYEPEPYKRWTMKGMIDISNELKVAGEFWDFLGGKDSYNTLLTCFEKVGIELRPEIDSYFQNIIKNNF